MKQKDTAYVIYLYFNGFSLRHSAIALKICSQKPYCNKGLDSKCKTIKRLVCRKANVTKFIIDKTELKMDPEIICFVT